MKSLNTIRKEINQIDQQIIDLLKARYSLLESVLEDKIRREEPVENLQREDEVLGKIREEPELYHYYLKETYKKIMELSKAYQWHCLFKENIYLIGFMAVGKTTLGEVLSKKIHWSFLDTDLFIEEMEQRRIKEIFKESGEDYFRELEAKVIENIHKDWLKTTEKKVIACGGGVILNPENLRIMKQNGIIVYLKGDIHTICKRLSLDDSRPLLSEAKDIKKRVEGLLKDRQDLYKEVADITIFVGEKAPDKLVNALLLEIESYERKRSLSE